jgi:predicted nucleotidyltransferase
VSVPAELAGPLVADLVSQGADVVALTGSYARGNATRRSDLDVTVIGETPRYVVELRDGLLVAQAWSTEAEQRRRFGDPREVGAAVPGWREAVILHDPDGRGARLKEEALAWRWEQIDDLSDEWVANQLAGFAEEVQKLVAAVESQNVLTAAVLRTLLAFRMPRIVSVHHWLLYGSENVLWDQVADVMGAEWRRTHAAALSVNGESFAQSCDAALHLFRLSFDAVQHLLDEGETAVVRHALSVIRER